MVTFTAYTLIVISIIIAFAWTILGHDKRGVTATITGGVISVLFFGFAVLVLYGIANGFF